MVFLGVYRAVYDYAPQSDEELEIKEGDLLFVLEKSSDDDWWKCKKKAASDDEDEPEGLVPNNYVEEAKPTYHAKALYDYSKQTDEELSFREETRLNVYDDTDPDWTLVGCDGEFGFAPAIYIEPASSVAAASSPVPAAAPTPALAAAPMVQQRELAPPPMPMRPAVADEPIPGEEGYPGPNTAPSNNPATALASIIAQRTGGAQSSPSTERDLASLPLPSRPQYTPEESEEEAPPPMPRRPESQYAQPSPPARSPQFAFPRSPEPPGVLPSPPYNRAVSGSYGGDPDSIEDALPSPGGFRLYSVHEMVSHMGKNKKMPTTLGINIAKGVIMISPEKSRDGPNKEWTADKLQNYSIEGKHVFVDLVRPSKSVDFHAGAKDTAQEIVALLGELAGAVRAEGLREVIAASAGTGAPGQKKGKMVYEFMAQSNDEVTVAVDDEVLILDDVASEEWWKVRRLKNGKEGVVPSSYVEITGTIPADSISGLTAARSTVEQNRLEEARLAKEASKKDKAIPERGSSLAGETNGRRGNQRSSSDKHALKDGPPKSKPNSARIRTWTDRSGTFKVEAEFIGLRENKIHLHKLNGVKIAVPVGKMAVEDLEYVENATGLSLDEDKPLSDIKRRSTLKRKDGKQTAGATIQSKDQEFWFDFFLECGVNPQICERYAGAFSRDQMTKDVLEDINEPLLRTLGLKEGDILRVMKHLDTKFSRKRTLVGGAPVSPSQEETGGLFSGPGGALKNNTRKGRPAPAVQTNDIVDESAFKIKDASPAVREPPTDAKATPLTDVPARQPAAGFDDDAWEPKPARSQTLTATVPAPAPARSPKPVEPLEPLINDDIASLQIATPTLQPAIQPTPAPSQPQHTAAAPPPVALQQPPVADKAIFDQIAALAPPRQRPLPPAQQPGGPLGMAPPERTASAPVSQRQHQFAPAPLQAQLTGYPNQAPQNYGYQPHGFIPQPTGVQAVQQNYPPLQPQPTGLNFTPQSNFGQSQLQMQQPTGFTGQNFGNQPQQQQFGPQPTGYGQQQPLYPQQQQPNYQQQLQAGAQSNSPFADPTTRPFQPNQPSGLANSFGPPQQTGFGQPAFNISQPTGFGTQNGGFGQQPPQLPPQQTGGVFGPSQPLGGLQAPPAPLVAQRTGPAPAIRFGVTPGVMPLQAQPTGRANLAKATPQNPFGF